MIDFDEYIKKNDSLPYDEAPPRVAQPLRQKPEYNVYRVSDRANELIEANEQACVAMGMADTPEKNHIAYSHLAVTRECLYQWVQYVEQMSRVKIERDVVKRF